MTIRRNLVGLSFVLVMAVCSQRSFAADPPKPKTEPGKPAKKAVPANRLEAQLSKAFKLWDRNKDNAIDKDEIEEALAPKSTGKKGAPAPLFAGIR